MGGDTAVRDAAISSSYLTFVSAGMYENEVV